MVDILGYGCWTWREGNTDRNVKRSLANDLDVGNENRGIKDDS